MNSLPLPLFQDVKVFAGDNFYPAADADYKIALSFINLGNNDLAFKHFNYIIKEYPNNLDLISKSKKFIEGNK